MSYQGVNPSQGESMTDPTSEGSRFDQVYEEINVPCPTCRGTGRISRGDASLQELVNLAAETSKQPSSPPSVPIDRTIFSRIREEMKSAGVSQAIFASVAFNRTQGLLSEILRQGDRNVNLEGSRCLRENLHKIQAFLNLPAKDRLRMYAEYRQKSKSTHKLHREYYEGLPNSERRVTISVHAKGVLNEFSQQVSCNPDKLALKVLSEALGIQKAAILKYLQQLKGDEENLSVLGIQKGAGLKFMQQPKSGEENEPESEKQTGAGDNIDIPADYDDCENLENSALGTGNV